MLNGSMNYLAKWSDVVFYNCVTNIDKNIVKIQIHISLLQKFSCNGNIYNNKKTLQIRTVSVRL